MSIPLLGFSVTSSHCGVSRLLTWSLFLSVPRYLYLDGSSSVLFGGVQLSPPVPRLSLGWPTRSISLLQLSLLLCSWGLCSSSFPPSRLWSSRVAFSSVAVPLVFSWLLLECSYSPQLVCGFSRVSASCLAPAFGGYSSQGILVLCLRFVSVRLPSFPAPQVSVVVSPGWSPHLWVSWFSHPTFVRCGLVICCLSPV